ncbi:MAG TPA: VOC family protein [Steroidobacteraceae bacterium]|nr:VOC family protein [Steroidobacteraceae bacterium]
MSSSAVLGQFLWHELLTADPAAGAGFYSKVLGWSAQPWEGSEEYTMLSHAKGPVGGARVVGKDALASKAGPNWLTYVGVPDIEAALAAVKDKGGQVVHPVTAVGADGGRYAVISDPQGAVIGVYEPGTGMSGGANATPAPVDWHELTAEDPVAALQFYKDIFGWEVVGTHPMGGEVGTYYLFGKGTTQMGGAFVRGKNLAPSWPRWLVYLTVPSVTAAVEAAKAAGGQVLNGPHQVPGGNWIAQIVDSHGVPVALHGPKEAAAASKAPAKTKAPAKSKAKSKAKAAPVKAKAAPVKAKATPKVKAKTKVKAKVKSKAKTKAKSASKSKQTAVKSKVKTKAKAKGRAKAKKTPAPKRKAKTPVRAKARKAPRRGK